MGSFSFQRQPTRQEQLIELNQSLQGESNQRKHTIGATRLTSEPSQYRCEGLYRGHIVSVVRHVTMRSVIGSLSRELVVAYISCTEKEVALIERESIHLLGQSHTFVGPAGPWQAPGARIANSGVKIHGDLYIGFDFRPHSTEPAKLWYELGRFCDAVDEAILWKVIDDGE